MEPRRQRRLPCCSDGERRVDGRAGLPCVGLHRLDLVVGDEIILELKAVKALEDIHFAQLRSYLKATGLKVGLLLNFNAPTLLIKRVVL